ncbi:PKD domain-containing protein [Haloarculaceae archaeon H-GB2-1]|nr:PKD domain-containing protein [Haloarculaceae archaeon H-GB1-1]MEA5387420.1 PKD domain-containing protein [Haloarculaceae archaeon H-GB11]MEA5408894.1 PKD domain-containing protein [Haloarculaceae archaeon H-GB2-1]
MTIGLLLTLLVSAAGVANADDANHSPLADAGLDQSVKSGSEVYLSSNGSSDPDGRIVDYHWQVVTPSGTTERPYCFNCERAKLFPTEHGRYEVTVTVTDDDGATASDTMYVDVSTSNPPTVSIDGPSQGSEDETFTYEAAVDSTDTPLSRVVWRVDDEVMNESSVEGYSASPSITFSPDDAGRMEVSATVWDAGRQRATDTKSVSVHSTTSGTGVCGLARGYGVDTRQDCDEIFNGADRSVTKEDGTKEFMEVNGEDGLQKSADQGKSNYNSDFSSESNERREDVIESSTDTSDTTDGKQDTSSEADWNGGGYGF